MQVRDTSNTSLDIHINGQRAQAEVTELSLKAFLDEPKEVHVDTRVELPISQGFGMSGAGALSTLMAINEAVNGGRSKEELTAIAHRAEVLSRTGLGDVYPQLLGGLDIREVPGAPPFGQVHRIPVESDMVLCVLGPPLATRSILSNEMIVSSINGVGRRCVERFLRRRDLDHFFQLAWQFARQTVLATTEVQAAVLKAGLHGTASMCMLGNSIFAMGQADQLEDSLREHGDVFRVNVDNEGARVL